MILDAKFINFLKESFRQVEKKLFIVIIKTFLKFSIYISSLIKDLEKVVKLSFCIMFGE